MRMHTSATILLATWLATASLPCSGSAFSFAAVFAKRTHSSLDSSITILEPQFFPKHGSKRVKISYGPYTVPSMHVNNGMANFQEETTRLPCTDCLITWMQAGLEYLDGTVANADTGMWLHHTVFSNLNQVSPVCPTKRFGDRFFASGNERTPVNICANGTLQAGYYIGPEDNLGMGTELMNMAHEPRDAILTVTFEYIPSVPKDFDKVKSYWLDIGGCGSSSFPAEPDTVFQYSSPPWTSNSTGRITFTASHLHDGGTHTEIRRNGKVICDSQAVYGSCTDSDSMSMDTEHITRLSECTDLGPVSPGDEWFITAYYDTSKHKPMTNMDGSLEPIMGISLVYVAESDCMSKSHHHHRALMLIIVCSVLGGAIALASIWFKMKGRSFREVFLRRKQDISLAEVDGNAGRPLLEEEYHDEV